MGIEIPDKVAFLVEKNKSAYYACFNCAVLAAIDKKKIKVELTTEWYGCDDVKHTSNKGG